MVSEFLKISPKITALPVVHGSGDFAIEVRRVMLSEKFDCLAVPLPGSFHESVETAVQDLPNVTLVIQPEAREYSTEWKPDSEQEDDEEPSSECSYVPIDPCQPVIAAIRIAMQERMHRAFIDLETEQFRSIPASLPDPYAVKQVAADRFAAAVLPAIPRPPKGQPRDRVAFMANRLRELEERFESILFVCSVTDFPWIREAYQEQTECLVEDEETEDAFIVQPDPHGLLFVLGELPYITGLYEQARARLDDDENLSFDGIKRLLLDSRVEYENEFQSRARRITPQLLSCYFRYVRNLSLIERRMAPDLFTLITAAQQTAGDQFAIKVAETAREYPYLDRLPQYPIIDCSIDKGRLQDQDPFTMVSRLPGHPMVWRTCKLNPKPERSQSIQWIKEWNPYGQCSWPPEDIAIENFRTRIKDTALDMLGNDLARTEKFTASMKDGLDIRETLRNWHTGDLYVKVFPPAKGKLDCVIMLFDSPADPREYPWRITWHAESHDESTLSLFATNFMQEPVGPGICLASYGGCMFLFPPRPIPDVWRDPRFDFTDTLEERIIAGGCYHSQEKHVALMSSGPPGLAWRRLARKYKKKLVHVPMARFSQQTLQQLRMFHVLNGHQIRSFAADYIRKA